MLFIIILASLLLPVWGKGASRGSSALKKTCQSGNNCIALREGELTAEVGLCVEIPCSFTTESTFTATNIIWSKCRTANANYGNSVLILNSEYPEQTSKSKFKGRVSLLEPDVRQRNCSIIINDLRKSDSGFYWLRVEGTLPGRRTKLSFTVKSASVSVRDLTQKPTIMVPPLTEGQQTTLSCTAPGLCSGSAPEFTWMWGGGGQNESNVKINFIIDSVSAFEQRHSSSLTFTPSAEHHGTNITCKVIFKNNISTKKTETLNVTYVKDPVISGERVLKLGDALNLTCSVDSFPPSVVTWTKLGSKQTLKNDTRTAKLIIPEMTAEDVGKYICTASQQSTNQTARTEVNVTILPIILISSTCELQSEILTCVCVSQGFPLPNIQWPQMENQTHNSLSTSVSLHTVNFVTTSVKDHNYTTLVCLSKNKFGEVTEDLEVVIKNVTKSELEKEDLAQKLFNGMKQPQVFVAFLIGLLLSAGVCCSVQKCHRKKQTLTGNFSNKDLEMMDVDPALANRGRHGHDRAEGGAEVDSELREVEYSVINFDLLKRGRPVGEESSLKTTEYAEIKTDTAKTINDNSGEYSEIVEVNQEEERNDFVIEEEEEEFLYSNVEDVMKEV